MTEIIRGLSVGLAIMALFLSARREWDAAAVAFGAAVWLLVAEASFG